MSAFARNSAPIRRSVRLAGAGLFVVTALTACNDARPPAVDTWIVRPGNFEDAIEETGLVEATRTISFKVTRRGTLISLPETGTEIKKGDLVYAIENEEEITDLQDEINELKTLKSELESNIESLRIAQRENRLDLDSSESELAYNRVTLEDVSIKLAETEVLLQRSVVPEDDLYDARYRASTGTLRTVSQDLSRLGLLADTETAEAEGVADIQRSALKADRALRRINDSKQRIAESKVLSPADGFFVRAQRWNFRENKLSEPRPGEDVREGQELGSLPDMDSLVVRTQIPEAALLRLREGGAARIEFDAFGGRSVPGTIQTIGKVAIERKASAGGSLMQGQSFSGQKVFEVAVRIDEKVEGLKPGITANVRFVLDRRDDVIAVPIEAVVRRGEKVFVRVQDAATGRLSDREVVVGARNGDMVVVESGLRSGERVATSESQSG